MSKTTISLGRKAAPLRSRLPRVGASPGPQCERRSGMVGTLEHVQRGTCTGTDWLLFFFFASSSFLNLPAVDASVAQVDFELGRSGQSPLDQRFAKAGLRCISAAPGGADARRSCGRRMSSPAHSRAASAQADLDLLGARLTLICSTSRLMIFSRSSSVSEVNRITSSSRFRNSGLKERFTSPSPCLPPCWARLRGQVRKSRAGPAFQGSARPGSTS